MKKIILTAIAALLMISLCACSAAKPANTEYIEKTTSYIDTLIETDKFTEEKDLDKLVTKWTRSEAVSAALPDVLTLDDSIKITLGETTVKDLKEMDFKLAEKTPETVADGKSAEISVIHGDQSFTVFTEINGSEDPVPVEELTITGFYITGDAFSPFDCNGINDKSSLEDVMSIDLPINNISVSTHGSDSLVYVTYKRFQDGDKPDASLTVGAEYNDNTSKVISVQFSADQ